MGEIGNLTTPGFVEGRFGGSCRGRHQEIMEMVLRFSILEES
jgi:hypothetical protein